MNSTNGVESPRRHSTPDYSSVTIFGHTHARAPRRTTADSQKHGWDNRTKVVPSAAATESLVRAATARSSHAFSRASSDAGSVIDSVSSTPRGRGPSRSQQQHTLQAVASRLQHVQSSELAHSSHRSMYTPHAAAAAGHWESGDCSDAASWAEEHLDWKEQHAADISRRELESKQALSQLTSSVQQLENKLHEVMARQARSSSQQASTSRQYAQSGKHSRSDSIAASGLIAAGVHSASRASSISLEEAKGFDAEQIALAKKAKHIAQWVQQSEMPDQSEVHEVGVSRTATAEHSFLKEPQDGTAAAAANQSEDQLVSCSLTHHDSSISIDLRTKESSDCTAEQKQQQNAQTRYSRWLTAVGVVEDATQQLKVRNHNPGPGAITVSYARLLRDCASSAAE